ncbi:RNA methyltransferase [Caproiciproducens galactitolivorans]|uniref:23S rRNA (Uridine(2479)-2'-O)-methyltransferase n=1 Tax=Caproiciproducens galactitolivorans TaxID=642589 RepID=A0A4Z0YMX9_9FIRM|nr:RNA methyltransferase [Caproiciproducens galactitolivorans]QEY34238.1 RNA methyltransferase [Caproiciproducens galactitolivorans]TGJ78002.1 23S rRNA (uridine(2479)-2'-O)-methyltransferase [Caproiciproducens galactitolivorans]
MPDQITSRKNEIIKQAARLCTSAEIRREHGLYLVEGARLCRDAAQSGVKIETLFYTAQAEEKYKEYIASAADSAQTVYEVAPHVAALLSETKTPQGVFCVCKMNRAVREVRTIPVGRHYLALENLQDPANLGAILRTAEALGIGGVILGGSCCDIYSPKALRASMGAVFRLPFFLAPDMLCAIKLLRDMNFACFAAVPDAAAQPVTAVNFHNHPTVLIVGNEGNGLAKETIQACSGRVTIPMLGRAESLNASASAAILMWEMMRAESGGVSVGN